MLVHYHVYRDVVKDVMSFPCCDHWCHYVLQAAKEAERESDEEYNSEEEEEEEEEDDIEAMLAEEFEVCVLRRSSQLFNIWLCIQHNALL